MLSANYPGSEWYQRAFDLMQKYQPGAVTIAARPPVASAPVPVVPASAPAPQPARLAVSEPVAAPAAKPAKVKSEKKSKAEKKTEPARCGKGGLFHKARCDTTNASPPTA